MSWFSSIFKGLGDFLSGGGGSLLGGGANYLGQRETNKNNLQIARETNAMNRQIADLTNASNAKQVKDLMDWQKGMSDTAHQREMADLKKAGINPMLAATLGGSSTPPGASIPQTTGQGAVTGAPMQNEMSGIPAAISSAMEMKRLKSVIQNIDESTRKVMSDIDLNNVMKANYLADATLKDNSAKVAAVNAKNASLLTPGLEAEAKLDRGAYGKAMRAINRSATAVNSAVSVGKAIGGVRKPVYNITKSYHKHYK